MAHDIPYGYEIQKLPDGGYMVGESLGRQLGDLRSVRFAATTIDEALKYIKSKLEPKVTK